jgi:hypothetical protein
MENTNTNKIPKIRFRKKNSDKTHVRVRCTVRQRKIKQARCRVYFPEERRLAGDMKSRMVRELSKTRPLKEAEGSRVRRGEVVE